jgi:APA family basic amino acid/polyamine antiporter
MSPRRGLGPAAAVAMVIGNIVGSGIFLLPTTLAPYGWNAVIAWVFTLSGALCLAWVFAQLVAKSPSGGAHGAVTSAFGDTVSFYTSWGYYAGISTAIAAITVAGVGYLQRLVPAIDALPFGPQVVALALIITIAWLNTRALAGGIQIVATIIKMLPFVLVIGLGAWLLAYRGGAVLLPVEAVPFHPSTVFAAVGITLFAMLGLEGASMLADAVDHPSRNVPRATLVGTLIAGVVTLLSSSAVALMLPPAALVASTAPIADFIGAFVGSGAGIFVTVCAVVSCVGTLNGNLFLGTELPATMARAGVLPGWFGRVNALGVPVNSVWLGAAMACGFVMLSASRGGVAAFEFLALVTTVTSLFLYLAATLAAARFARDGRLASRASLWVAIAGGLAFAIVATLSCGLEAVLWSFGLLALGWPLRHLAAVESRDKAPG